MRLCSRLAYLTELLCLHELSIGSGMAVEVTHFDNLLHAREWITVGHSHGSDERPPIGVQDIHGDEGCRGDKVAFVVLPCSAIREIGCVNDSASSSVASWVVVSLSV